MNSFQSKHVFVTVGTTKFPQLIQALTKPKVLKMLKKLNCNFIQVQTGKDFEGIEFHPNIKASVRQENDVWYVELPNYNISIKYNEYFENFQEEIAKSNLVISHAGAGSCLDVLRLNKPLIVVVNEDLMDNHQVELASQLQKNGYLYYCTCDTLANTLRKDFFALQPYPKPDETLFARYLDKSCGFA
ncbi:UDP-N-acetylglucosamine transferase subunit ALG13 homolog [Anthonomus grandis grandis]|uniref:UDP-N-acetylglucosamine transferase subunit ALG13 homolog n=1 Tax=Anthonomus grandis grandis TaxID=2921223 RepID=UPI00216532F1|nr:UDP-N-acetylglucosamine transferase subunit ALG13 homolog [Anthonomus grandis grandis]